MFQYDDTVVEDYVKFDIIPELLDGLSTQIKLKGDSSEDPYFTFSQEVDKKDLRFIEHYGRIQFHLLLMNRGVYSYFQQGNILFLFVPRRENV